MWMRRVDKRHKGDCVEERIEEQTAEKQLEADPLPENVVREGVHELVPAVLSEKKAEQGRRNK